MTTDEAYEIIKRHPELPSPRGIALEVVRLARDPNCTLSALAKLIEQDPAITSRLIRLVNSSAYPRKRPITSVTDAAAYLGTRMVQCVALTFNLVSTSGACPAFDYTGFWSGSLARALVGGRLAQQIGNYVADEVFTIGLMSQIGRLVFATTQPDSYNTLLTSIECNSLELCELEQELFGIDHNEVTARLLVEWGMPAVVGGAIRAQDVAIDAAFVLQSESGRMARLLAIAAQVARHLSHSRNESLDLTDITQAADRLGLPATTILDILEAVVPHWLGMLEVFEAGTASDSQQKQLLEEARILRYRLSAVEHANS